MPSKPAGAGPFVPERPSLTKLKQAVQHCEGCELYRFATQAVFGEGPLHASIVLVGEQPGNDEDIQGHPFVGPSGKLLDRALQEAGIRRSETYLAPGESRECTFEGQGPSLSQYTHAYDPSPPTQAQQVHLYLVGTVRYRDELGVVRSCGSCRHYVQETDKFDPVDDADFEYAD